MDLSGTWPRGSAGPVVGRCCERQGGTPVRAGATILWSACPVVLETAEHPSGQEALRHPPQRGEFVSILDAALMESGLMEAWLKGVLPACCYAVGGVVSGRRPQLHHDRMLDRKAGDQWLVQASGRVVEVMHLSLDDSERWTRS